LFEVANVRGSGAAEACDLASSGARLGRARGCLIHAEGALPVGCAAAVQRRPNVRGEAGPTAKRRARRRD